MTDRLTDAMCKFVSDNQRTTNMKTLLEMLREQFGYEATFYCFAKDRARAITDGRLEPKYRTAGRYPKRRHETTLEHTVKAQRAQIEINIMGGQCRHFDDNGNPCGSPTIGRFCEEHARQQFAYNPAPPIVGDGRGIKVRSAAA